MDRITLFLLVAILGVAQCQFGDFEFRTYRRTAFGDSIDAASMKLLKEAYNAADNKNVVASPLGVLTLLGLYASGAEGAIREEILTYFGSADYKATEDSFAQIKHKFAWIDSNVLTMGNKVYVSDKYRLQQRFLLSARRYGSEVNNINFGDPAAAAEAINKWSSRNTNGKISEPVSAGDIDPQTAVALLNVIMFQGHWHVPFNASNTKDKPFRLDRSNTVQKPMMHLMQSLYYRDSPELGAQMIELPYKESQFRMIVILPNEVDGLAAVLSAAAEGGVLSDVFRMQPAGADVNLDMPKFEIKSKLDLNDLLPKVGVSRIFEEPASGIVVGKNVAVSRGLQEAFVKVDEEGATAGAFTGLIAVPMSSMSQPPPPIPFKVDRPFLFAILYDDIVLFAGTYTN